MFQVYSDFFHIKLSITPQRNAQSIRDCLSEFCLSFKHRIFSLFLLPKVAEKEKQVSKWVYGYGKIFLLTYFHLWAMDLYTFLRIKIQDSRKGKLPKRNGTLGLHAWVLHGQPCRLPEQWRWQSVWNICKAESLCPQAESYSQTSNKSWRLKTRACSHLHECHCTPKLSGRLNLQGNHLKPLRL